MTENNQKDSSGLFDYSLTDSTKPSRSNDLISDKSTYLQDLSPSDKPWDKHRASSETVQSYYCNSDFDRYSERMDACSQLLGFALNSSDEGAVGLKLSTASFCRVRHCPVCQWRRSLRWKAKAYEAIPVIVSDYPAYRWLFLTLTVRNCQISDLRFQLSEMQKGFIKLARIKLWPAIGWLRSTEVTRGLNGDAHPHFHCLLLVPSSYFTRDYIRQSEWATFWKRAMKLDYDPQVNVKAIAKDKNPAIIIPELLKYCTKESDLLADAQWLIELTKQLHKTRAIATGGILKQYFKELEKEPEDLIGLDEESENNDQERLNFSWNTKPKKYKLIE